MTNNYNIGMGNRTCHKGPVKVLDHKGLRIYGASMKEAEVNFYKFDLVISLEKISPIEKHRGKALVSRNVYSNFLRYLTQNNSSNTEHLELYWPDFGVPQLEVEFWVKLSRFLGKKGLDRSRNDSHYNVMVHCFGGHGRTGTALAILCAMCDKEVFYYSNIIEIIRNKHCKNAVENGRQIKYVGEMLGIEVVGEGTKKFDFSTKSYESDIVPSTILKKYGITSFDTYDSSSKHTNYSSGSKGLSIKCLKQDHIRDMQELGYCPGCGDMTKQYTEIVNKAIEEDKVKNSSKIVGNSGIGRAITQEDIDRRKEKK